jgi:hypothetical protein
MRELWLFHFSTACCPEFQHVQPSVIRPYPLVGPPIALPLDSLEHRLHGASENPNISNCSLLRLMQTSR